ncbi:DNA polymerase III subunit delta [Nonlabens marinus]|uniref:DNA polymerase III subunit delta n=1 Tax=Nonlabens marinus S1-08 TaxID=1454201 RepID=W8VWX7_9FLAO|nr:DNA polymerase III subunit delta [Nonlabens marinus]BAO56703.1 DNA polymerase III delta subunit [Nonlabens marinus S1-08]
MSDLKNILTDLKNKKYAPIYFLHGDEPFFIDQISDYIEDNVLDESEKGFNQMVLYGKDVKVEEIVEAAKRFPMMAEYQVIIIKEAQHLASKMAQMESYMANPSSSTILVFNYKYKKPDGRTKVFKNIKKNGLVFESKPIYDDRMPAWITSHLKDRGYSIDPKATQMLVEFIGNDLSRVSNELDKLTIVHKKELPITPQVIEENIGFSKDFNNFELRKAIGSRDTVKVHRIINYFAENPKDNPIVLTTAQLHSFFVQLLKVHGLNDRSPKNVARAVGINPFFVNELMVAVRNYPMKYCSRAIKLILEMDVKSKGVGAHQLSQADLLKETMVKIMAA